MFINRYYNIGTTFVLLFFFSISFINAQIEYIDKAEILGIEKDTGINNDGGGISFVDYNNDGWSDITLATGNNSPIIFYKSIEGVFFIEETLLPTETNYNYRMKSVLWVDYDNDGDKDFFMASDTDGNRLFKKTDVGLIDVTLEAGLPLDNLFTYSVSWADINNDGCLDMYVGNKTDNTPITNYLYQNNCDGTFSEVTNTIGLNNLPALTLATGFFDLNNDGWQDLYVSNDRFGENYIYKNNGDGTFLDIGVSSGADIVVDAMSVTVDDYNSDGYMDIFITNTPNFLSTPTTGSILLKNNGDETFTDVSEATNTILDSFSWGSVFVDADNDNDLDLYLNCSYNGSNGFASYAFFESIENDVFTSRQDVGFLDNNRRSFSCAIGDYNSDGRQDFIVNNNEGKKPFIWSNESIHNNNFISLELEGTVSNRDAIGTRIEVFAGNKKQFGHIMCGEGYMSQNSLKEYFGLNTSTLVDYVKITWPSGIVDYLFNLEVNRNFKIVEGSTLSSNNLNQNDVKFWYSKSDSSLNLESKNPLGFVEIYSLSGKVLLKDNSEYNSLKLNISFLPKGTYIIKTSKFNSTSVNKFIVY